MMVLKLKTECGDQFITKVEGMLKDLTSSDNFMKEYMTIRGEKVRAQSVEVNFHVLGSNCWPISQSIKCKVPKVLNSCQEDFE